MSASSASPSSAMRRAWMAVLAHTPRAELEAALSQALEGASPPEFDWLRPPETGLAMVRGRIGGSGDAFNLGEATVTRATLRLRSPAAHAPVGVACHSEVARVAGAEHPGERLEEAARRVDGPAVR